MVNGMTRNIARMLAVSLLAAAGIGCGGQNDNQDDTEQEQDPPVIVTTEDAGNTDTCQVIGEETCNGRDNDCDGVVDEGCPCEMENMNTGVCQKARISENGECTPPPSYEQDESTCDGQDNDCDGVADEGCECVYDHRARGVCADASIDSETGECAQPEAYEEDESTCDGLDNDCDGAVDEGCDCTGGETRECYTGPTETRGVGQCQTGVQTCEGGSWSSDCEQQTTPTAETCDGRDNDCDGEADETDIQEGFEESSSGWQAFSTGTRTPDVDVSNSEAAHSGNNSAKASDFFGVCDTIGGVAKDFDLDGNVDSLSVWIAAEGGSGARVGVGIQDSSGTDVLWEETGSGGGIQLSWTQKTFDISQYDSDFKLIVGNTDDTSTCQDFDSRWTVWVDDVKAGPGCN